MKKAQKKIPSADTQQLLMVSPWKVLGVIFAASITSGVGTAFAIVGLGIADHYAIAAHATDIREIKEWRIAHEEKVDKKLDAIYSILLDITRSN